MTRHADHARHCGALLVALVLLAVVTGVYPHRAQAATIDVTSSRAEPHFPNDITFSLAATSNVDIVRVELLYAVGDQETLNGVLPDVTPAKAVSLTLPVDFRLRYEPPGVDIAFRWRLVDAAGAVTETDPQVVLWQDNRFSWDAIKTDEVSVYAYNGDPDFNTDILNSAQATMDELQTRFGVERSRPLRIWVYSSSADFGGAQVNNSESWIAGASYPELGLILAVLPDGDRAEVGRVVPHEVSHQVLHQATKNPFNWPPPWLDEGLAVYNQAGGNETFPAMVTTAEADGRLPSLRALNSAFPYDPAETRLAYAASFDVVGFVIEEFGEEKMDALIDVYREGVSHEDAVQRALGISLDDLDRRWKASISARTAKAGSPADSLGHGPTLGASGPVAEGLASGALAIGVAVFAALVGFLVRAARGRLRSPQDS